MKTGTTLTGRWRTAIHTTVIAMSAAWNAILRNAVFCLIGSVVAAQWPERNFATSNVGFE